MRVEILAHTEFCLKTIHTAFKQCYSPKSATDLNFYDNALSKEQMEKFISDTVASGHLSPIEHVSFTFAVSEVSRTLSHQLVRHRIGSYCVSKDTKIKTSSQKTNNKTIEELFSLPAQYKNSLKLRCVDESTGEINYSLCNSIVQTGLKQVFRVTTEHGYSVKTTSLHRFFREGRVWATLDSLKVGDYVYINGAESYKDRQWLHTKYIEENMSQEDIGALCGCTHHTIRAWVKRFKLQKPLGSWTIGVEPHNKNKNKLNYPPLSEVSKNDDISNLKEVCVACHKALHKQEIRNIVVLSKIVSIECLGEEETYDIEMVAPHHNFIANGFVVHNSQQSQRYVAGKDFGYVTPPKIAAHPEAREVYDACMSDIGEAYDRLCSLFSYDKKFMEDARFVLPGGAHTSIVFTMNCRSLLNFFEHRCCDRAQWEIRAMASVMLGQCKDVLPCVFKDAGAKCRKLGYCPEGKFCCGKYPTAAAQL